MITVAEFASLVDAECILAYKLMQDRCVFEHGRGVDSISGESILCNDAFRMNAKQAANSGVYLAHKKTKPLSSRRKNSPPCRLLRPSLLSVVTETYLQQSVH